MSASGAGKTTLARQISIVLGIEHTELEPPLHTFLTDPDHIVRWSWRSHRTVRARVASVRVAHPSLRVVRLRSSREVGQWIAGPLRTVAAR